MLFAAELGFPEEFSAIKVFFVLDLRVHRYIYKLSCIHPSVDHFNIVY